MRIFFDTEFIEDGKTIDLLSIGMVRSDGATYYAESAEADHTRASDWVKENVLPHLTGEVKPRALIAQEIIEFAGERPEFWAYYADYDWVALCQLHGRMIDLPKGWPMFCRDVKQLCVSLGDPNLPKQNSAEHNALADAQWAAEAFAALSSSQGESRIMKWIGEPQKRRRKLVDCPIGLFEYRGHLCLKTEYGNNEGRIDAYIVSTGEFFWGDAPQTIASQRAQLVTPITLLSGAVE